MNEQISKARQNHFVKGFPIFFKFKSLSQDWLMSLTEEELIQKLRQFEPFHFSSRFMQIFHYTSKFLGFWNTQLEMGNLSEFRTVMLVYYRLFQQCFGRFGVQFFEVVSLQKLDVEILRNFVSALKTDEIDALFAQAYQDIHLEYKETTPPSTNIITLFRPYFKEKEFDQDLCQELENYLETDPRKVLIPSAGIDISPERFFAMRGDLLFGKHSVFVHIDYYFSSLEKLLEVFPGANISSTVIHFGYKGISTMEIIKIDQEGEITWIIYFAHSLNEAVIKEFVLHSVKFETLISKLDGATSGMGGPMGIRIQTPTYFFFPQLQFIRMITEYGTRFFLEMEQNENYHFLQDFEDWVHEDFPAEISKPILKKVARKKMSYLLLQGAEEHDSNDLFRRFIDCHNPLFLITRELSESTQYHTFMNENSPSA